MASYLLETLKGSNGVSANQVNGQVIRNSRGTLVSL